VELRQYGVKPTDGNVPRFQIIGAHVKEKLRNMQIDCQNYAYEFGVDKPEIDEWTCP
jgi:xylulose-5-phosphate/fructose-6-phosphate phosphoketolase